MKPTHNRIFCIGCHHAKMLFETSAKAENFIRFNGMEIAELAGKAPVRAYFCTFCGGWHVTSVSDDEANDRELRDQKMWERIRRRNSRLFGDPPPWENF